MDFAKNFKRLREKNGLSMQFVADRLGVHRITVHNWERGNAYPHTDNIMRAAELFHVPYTSLIGNNEPPQGAITPQATSAFVPVLELGAIHAGDPIEPRDDARVVEIPATVADAHKNGYLLRVVGNCMDRRYPDGCSVLIDPDMQPTQGQAVAVQIDSDEVLLRVYHKGASTLMLSADSHEEYDDLIINGEGREVDLLGVAVWFQAWEDVRA